MKVKIATLALVLLFASQGEAVQLRSMDPATERQAVDPNADPSKPKEGEVEDIMSQKLKEQAS